MIIKPKKIKWIGNASRISRGVRHMDRKTNKGWKNKKNKKECASEDTTTCSARMPQALTSQTWIFVKHLHERNCDLKIGIPIRWKSTIVKFINKHTLSYFLNVCHKQNRFWGDRKENELYYIIHTINLWLHSDNNQWYVTLRPTCAYVSSRICCVTR
jgi:hypothetical protein